MNSEEEKHRVCEACIHQTRRYKKHSKQTKSKVWDKVAWFSRKSIKHRETEGEEAGAKDLVSDGELSPCTHSPAALRTFFGSDSCSESEFGGGEPCPSALAPAHNEVLEQSCLKPSVAKSLFMQLDSIHSESPCHHKHAKTMDEESAGTRDLAPLPRTLSFPSEIAPQNDCHCLACCRCTPKERLSGTCRVYMRRSTSTSSLDRGLLDLGTYGACELDLSPSDQKPATLPKASKWADGNRTEILVNKESKSIEESTEQGNMTESLVNNWSKSVERVFEGEHKEELFAQESSQEDTTATNGFTTGACLCPTQHKLDNQRNTPDFSDFGQRNKENLTLGYGSELGSDIEQSLPVGCTTGSDIKRKIMSPGDFETDSCVERKEISPIGHDSDKKIKDMPPMGQKTVVTNQNKQEEEVISPQKIISFFNFDAVEAEVDCDGFKQDLTTRTSEQNNEEACENHASQSETNQNPKCHGNCGASLVVNGASHMVDNQNPKCDSNYGASPVVNGASHVVDNHLSGAELNEMCEQNSAVAGDVEKTLKPATLNHVHVLQRHTSNPRPERTTKPQGVSVERLVEKSKPVALLSQTEPLSTAAVWETPCSPSKFKEKADEVEDWFVGLNDDQKNTLFLRLLRHSDIVQKHFLCDVLGTDTHPDCPPNCQDRIGWLPQTLVLQIFSYLDPVSLCRAAQVCHVWRHLVNEASIWRRFCLLPKWKLSRSGEQKQVLQHRTLDGRVRWKDVFGERFHLRNNWLHGRCTVRTFEGHMQETAPSTSLSLYQCVLFVGVSCVQFDDTRIVSGSSDKTIKVWNIRTNSPWSVQTLVGHSGTVRCLHLEGNRLVSGSTDRTIKVWDLSTQHSWSSIACKLTMVGHTDTVRCLQVDEEKVISGSYDQTLKLWSMRTGRCTQTLVGHEAAVLCVHFDLTKIVSGSCDKTIKVWNFEGVCMMTLRGHQDAVTCLQFDTQRIISGSLDCNLKFWDIHTGQCINTIDWKASEGHTGVVRCLQADSWRVVSASDDRTLKVWSLETGQRLVTLRNHSDGVTCLQFNDSKIVSGSYDKTVKLWDFSSM